jgi:tripartite-type tricarboxylate transporter receptor subunit TctC
VLFAAGGPSDVLARNLGSAMSATLKQQMIIENVAGAVTLGIARASRAHPDGYTVLLTHVGIATAPYRRLPYDTINDFEPIGRVADVPMTPSIRNGSFVSPDAELYRHAACDVDVVAVVYQPLDVIDEKLTLRVEIRTCRQACFR